MMTTPGFVPFFSVSNANISASEQQQAEEEEVAPLYDDMEHDNDDDDDGNHVNTKTIFVDDVTPPTYTSALEIEKESVNESPLPIAMTSWQKAYRIFVKVYIVCFALFFLFVTVILIGTEVEKVGVADNELDDPDYLYNMPEVCGYNPVNGEFRTFTSELSAHDAAYNVSHCGECADCSNMDDIWILEETKNTLTETTTECAKMMMNPFKYGVGRDSVAECMREKVGFTLPCEDCWVDNVICDYNNCLFTCLKTTFLLGENNNKGSGEDLNDCLYCDEVMCGEGKYHLLERITSS